MMVSEDELRVLWRKRWLSSINELTSLQLQKQTWLSLNLSSPHWSYVEFMCCYFDDLFCGNSYQDFINWNYLSNQEYEIIKGWHSALNEYSSPDKKDYANASILIDEKWLQIIQIGIQAKEKLVNLLSLSEAKYLTEDISPG